MAKKILTMAIALMMICSLFAMSAMAVNTYGSEIITDGGAEVDLPYTDGVKAIMASNATLTRTNSVAYESSYSLELEANSVTNSAELFLMYLPVTPGKTYELSYDILAYDVTPGYTGANMQRTTATYRTATGSSAGTASSATFYDLFINNGYWTKKTVTYAIPNDATITHLFPKIMLPGSARLAPGGTVTGAYIDNISFREVLSSTPDENSVPNASFEDIVYASASSYTNTNGFVPQYFDTASNGYTDLYIYGRGNGYTADGVTAHSGNNFIGLKALNHQFRMTSPFASIEYGKTYVCSVWFNGKNLTDDSVYPQIMVAGKASSGTVSGFTAVLQDFKDAYAVDGWQQLSFEFTTPEFVEGTTNCDLCQVVLIMNGTDGTIGYFDDLSIVEKKVVEPTVYDVTISGENAVTSVAAATSEGEAVNFTVAPKFGYYIQSITIGGVDFNGFDAYKGGTYSTGAIETDTEIVVTTASFAANDKGVSRDVATLPAVFAPTADSAVTFGKVLDTTDATSWGIELKKDGVGVTPYHGGSYLYKALATNANGQYAIEFIGLEAGEYTIRSYVYVNGVATFGAPATFVVE